MKPIVVSRGFGLWYSPDERIYYWQSEDGYGEETSQSFKTRNGAITSLFRKKLRFSK